MKWLFSTGGGGAVHLAKPLYSGRYVRAICGKPVSASRTKELVELMGHDDVFTGVERCRRCTKFAVLLQEVGGG